MSKPYQNLNELILKLYMLNNLIWINFHSRLLNFGKSSYCYWVEKLR